MEWPIIESASSSTQSSPDRKLAFTLLKAIALNYHPSSIHFTLCFLLLLKYSLGLQTGDFGFPLPWRLDERVVLLGAGCHLADLEASISLLGIKQSTPLLEVCCSPATYVSTLFFFLQVFFFIMGASY